MIVPMLSKATENLPGGKDYLYEIKLDGQRTIADISRKRLLLYTRNLQIVTEKYPELSELTTGLKKKNAIIDGEIVALDSEGRPSFQALQHRSTRGLSLAYVAFDVLAVGNESFLRRPLEERRAQLRSLLAPPPAGVMIPYSSRPGPPR